MPRQAFGFFCSLGDKAEDDHTKVDRIGGDLLLNVTRMVSSRGGLKPDVVIPKYKYMDCRVLVRARSDLMAKVGFAKAKKRVLFRIMLS